MAAVTSRENVLLVFIIGETRFTTNWSLNIQALFAKGCHSWN